MISYGRLVPYSTVLWFGLDFSMAVVAVPFILYYEYGT